MKCACSVNEMQWKYCRISLWFLYEWEPNWVYLQTIVKVGGVGLLPDANNFTNLPFPIMQASCDLNFHHISSYYMYLFCVVLYKFIHICRYLKEYISLNGDDFRYVHVHNYIMCTTVTAILTN